MQCNRSVSKICSKLSVWPDLILISLGDKATVPSAVRALRWLPSLPVTSFIYSMAITAAVTSDKSSKHTHIHLNSRAHMLHTNANFQGGKGHQQG